MTSQSNFSNQSQYSNHLAKKMDELFQSFEMIAALPEGEVRQQKIREVSALFELSEASYRQQFEHYLRQCELAQKPSSVAYLLKPVSLLDTKVSDLVDLLQELSLVQLSAVLGEAALLFAMMSYLVTIPSRQQQQVHNAREILLQSDREYDESRIAALKVLDKKCADNPGLIARNAYLKNLVINGCYRWSIDRQNQNQWSFRSRKLMNLSYSKLSGANLEGSDLTGANLERSDLAGANLEGSDLTGVNLRGADLTGANLSRANLTGADLTGAILNDANLYGVTASQANFTSAKLINAKAAWSYFNGVNFYRANLKQVNFNRSDLKGADFYKVNLEDASLRFADLQQDARFFGAQLRGADFWGAQWDNIFQIKRGKNWRTANKSPKWEKKVNLAMLPSLRIGLIKPKGKSSLFDAYELGMRRAANRRVDIWGFESEENVAEEAATIDRMIDLGMDAIILRPSDRLSSLPAIKKASEAGLAIITVDSCLEPDAAEDIAVACFNTDSEKMGYDSGIQLDKWAQKNIIGQQTSKAINIALVDGAAHDRNYPYLQGLTAAMDESSSSLSWKTVVSVGADDVRNSDEVKEILQAYPEIQILWGGSNVATKIALDAVKQLDREDEVAVFGILDLSQEQAERLLDRNNPLQSIIDQSGVQTGQQATQRAIAVLRGKVPGEVYEEHLVQHRLLTKDDAPQVQKLLNEAGSLSD